MTMRLTDEQVEWLARRVPDAPRSPRGGRPAMDKRQALRGIFWVLDNGAKWKDLPREFGAKSAVHKYFTQWVKSGVFENMMRDAGRLVEKPAARFDYTPYGELARAEAWSSGGGGGGGVPGAAALALASRVGHQGLFFDNLETPWSNEQLALTPVTSGPSGPGLPTGFRAPAGLYHNRNRSYLPSLGRFAQRDPNASGQVVALADWWAGRDPRIWKQGLDILSQYSDGLGLHQYVQNDPINTRDAAGLFGIVDIGFGSSTIGELYQDHADRVTDIGSSAEASLTSMFEDYALDQLGDLLWAMDWDSPDFAYSASGIDPTAYGYGVIDDGSVGVVSDRFARAGIVKRIKHHIATNKNWVRGERWSVRFRALFDKAGLSLRASNRMASDLR